MILLITGHSLISIGMKKAVEMIAGEQKDLFAIPFEEGVSPEEYNLKLEQIFEYSLKEEQAIICLTDILGGTPFKQCVVNSLKTDNSYVLSGMNLAMILEAVLLKDLLTAEEIVDKISVSAKENISVFKAENELLNAESDDGI